MARVLLGSKYLRTHLPRLNSSVSFQSWTSNCTIKQCTNGNTQSSRVIHSLVNNSHLVSFAKHHHGIGSINIIIANRYSSNQKQQNRNVSSASTTLTPDEVRKGIEEITDKFMEAKEYMEDAVSSFLYLRLTTLRLHYF